MVFEHESMFRVFNMVPDIITKILYIYSRKQSILQKSYVQQHNSVTASGIGNVMDP